MLRPYNKDEIEDTIMRIRNILKILSVYCEYVDDDTRQPAYPIISLLEYMNEDLKKVNDMF